MRFFIPQSAHRAVSGKAIVEGLKGAAIRCG